jgi:hypothetical protein
MAKSPPNPYSLSTFYFALSNYVAAMVLGASSIGTRTYGPA